MSFQVLVKLKQLLAPAAQRNTEDAMRDLFRAVGIVQAMLRGVPQLTGLGACDPDEKTSKTTRRALSQSGDPFSGERQYHGQNAPS